MTKFTLWLAAGSNNVLPAGDPFAHHLFLRCLFHAKHDPDLKFDVKTINVNKKSDDFKEVLNKNCPQFELMYFDTNGTNDNTRTSGLRRVPGIHTDEDDAFETEDEILDFLEFLPPKRPNDEEAENSTCDLFIKFARFIKDVEHKDTALNTELLRLEKYLQQQGTKFLCSDEMSQIDCLVLTRLHSIRIAAKSLKNYDFPSELNALISYMRRGYDEEIFRLSCPSDQEILLHWTERKDAPSLSAKDRAKLVRDDPTYSFAI